MQLHLCKSFLLLLSNPLCLKAEVQFEGIDYIALLSKHNCWFQTNSWPGVSLSLPLLCEYWMKTLKIFRMYCWFRTLHLLGALDMIFWSIFALGFYWSTLNFLYSEFQRIYPKTKTFSSFFSGVFICTLQTQNAGRDAVLSDRHNVFLLIHRCCIFFR